MGQDFRGDPASAMLEVLDPEQNSTFVDHYLEVEYDLSNVMFITTANSYNMPGPLLDRMEIISLAGYTEDEKREIAKQHLLPKVLKNHGLKPASSSCRTRRSTRWSAPTPARRACGTSSARSPRSRARPRPSSSRRRSPGRRSRREPREFLGVKKFRYGLAEKEDQIGVVTGLAWTSSGGEPPVHRGASAARQGADEDHRQARRRDEGVDRGGGLLCAVHRPQIGVEASEVRQDDIHVHVPDGATPRTAPRRASPW
jgi:ATP-dependent Lon protease